MMSTHGTIARTMADLRAGYEAMSAPNWDEPFWVPAPHEFPVPPRLRVALVVEDGGPIDPVVIAAVRHVGSVLESAGYEVTETAPPMLAEFFSLWKTVGVLDMMLGLVPALPGIDDAGLTTAMGNWTGTFPNRQGTPSSAACRRGTWSCAPGTDSSPRTS